MSDQMPGPFEPTKPDQWGIIQSAFEVAGFIDGPPVAFQIAMADGRRTVSVGILASVEDHYLSGSNRPEDSIVYFVDAEPLTILWRTCAVCAMVAWIEEGKEEDSTTSS